MQHANVSKHKNIEEKRFLPHATRLPDGRVDLRECGKVGLLSKKRCAGVGAIPLTMLAPPSTPKKEVLWNEVSTGIRFASLGNLGPTHAGCMVGNVPQSFSKTTHNKCFGGDFTQKKGVSEEISPKSSKFRLERRKVK